MLQQIISQSNTGNITGVEQKAFVVNNLYGIGSSGITSPTALWLNGKTFFIGDMGHENFNNNLQLFQYDHNSKSFYYANVGNGSDTNDEFGHPKGYLFEFGGQLYMGQTNVHNDPIDVHKTASLLDARSGNEFVRQIPGETAYPMFFKVNDGKPAIFTRQYPEGVGDFNLAILKSDSNMGGTFTQTLFTQITSGYRNYNFMPILYGTQTRYVLAGTFRANGGSAHFALNLFVTDSNFQVYTSPDGNFSKDVSINGALTVTEIENNFQVNGSFATENENLIPPQGIMIDDVWYGAQIKQGTGLLYVYKLEGNTLTETALGIANLKHDNFLAPFLTYNGKDVLFSVICDNAGTITKEIWAAPTDLSSFHQKYVFTPDPIYVYQPILLPNNLNKANGAYMMFLGYDYVTNEAIFGETEDKFFI